MSRDKEREQRDLDLVLKSYRALEEEQRNPSSEPFEREPVGRRAADRSAESEAEAEPEDEGEVMMYRGRAIRRSSSGTPGAGSSQGKPQQFRGAGGSKPRRRSSDSGKSAKGVSIDKIKQALTTLAEMHEEGLITKAEFEKKRRQLLDRL